MFKNKYETHHILILLCGTFFMALSGIKQTQAADYFCDALSNEENYSKKNHVYKVMVKGKDGWVFRSGKDFITDVPLTSRAVNRIKKIHTNFKEQGIDLVLLFPPTRGMLHADKIQPDDAKKFNYDNNDHARESYIKFLKTLQKEDIKIVGLPNQSVGDPFFYKRDHHWSPVGARIAAKELATYIKTLKNYKALTKTKYETTSLGEIDFESASDKIFKEICGTNLPSERIETFMTEPADAATGDDDLFGDIAEPQVVLVGTSNSTKVPSMANFEGFLKEALSTDILNMSISGGSIDSAITAYLNTDHYKEKKGKIIIWEVPGYYDVTKWEWRVYRQVTPAIHGDCEKDPIAENNIMLKKGVALLMKSLDDKKISGDDYYLSLNFSKPIKSKFTVNFNYSSKKRDKLSVKRSARYPHDGQFYVALKDKDYGPLSKIVLDIPSDMEGITLNARMCKVK